VTIQGGVTAHVGDDWPLLRKQQVVCPKDAKANNSMKDHTKDSIGVDDSETAAMSVESQELYRLFLSKVRTPSVDRGNQSPSMESVKLSRTEDQTSRSRSCKAAVEGTFG